MSTRTDQLAAHIHHRLVTGRTPSGETYSRLVIWADPATNRCPSCDQTINQSPGCPVTPGQFDVQEVSQQHGCGEWIRVPWTTLPEDAPADVVAAAAASLATERAEDCTRIIADVRRRLGEDLAEALAALSVPLNVTTGETIEDRFEAVATGDDYRPGVYRDGDSWAVWDFDPTAGDDGSDPIIVTERDL